MIRFKRDARNLLEKEPASLGYNHGYMNPVTSSFFGVAINIGVGTFCALSLYDWVAISDHNVQILGRWAVLWIWYDTI